MVDTCGLTDRGTHVLNTGRNRKLALRWLILNATTLLPTIIGPRHSSILRSDKDQSISLRKCRVTTLVSHILLMEN